MLRHCIELACTSGKKFQNQESGFVTRPDEGISLYENFLFCLALLRTKAHEHVLEAKGLLERLLFFQQQFESVQWQGNFPLFLHDFPYCKEHLQAVRIFPVLLWIQKGFHHILGIELAKRLDHAIKQLVTFCQKVEETLPLWAQVKLASCLFAYRNEPRKIPLFTDVRVLGDPVVLGELISAAQLYPDGNWEPFWDYLSKSWHTPSLSFIGPAYKIKTQEPLPYDYFMGLFSERLSPKADKIGRFALAAALVHPHHRLTPLSYPFEMKTETFWIEQRPTWARSVLHGQFASHESYGLYPLYFVTEGHFLCVQPHHARLVGASFQEFFFDVPQDKEEILSIWFDEQTGTDVRISEQKATCFSLDAPMEIRLGTCSLKVGATLVSGEGQFLWHIRRGYRQKPLDAPDVQVMLRAIRGKGPCHLKISFM